MVLQNRKKGEGKQTALLHRCLQIFAEYTCQVEEAMVFEIIKENIEFVRPI